MIGQEMYELALRLWPINRSITGDGVRETLSIIQNELPELRVHEVPTGTKVFDWIIPKEWKANDAYIITPDGRKICDFKEHNLHLVGYSTPTDRILPLDELQHHLYSLPNQPDAIPYVTSYYKERWGFCLSAADREKLEPGDYRVFIDAELFDGFLTYAELVIPGKTEAEVFISTYVCHPSMANNELSGPCVTTFLAKKIQSLTDRRYTYRIVFVPETIGSITYLSRNVEHLRRHVVAGFNVTCIGDDRDYSYLPSRSGTTLSDSVAKHVLSHICPTFKRYTWSDRGSDERQYCAPGIDLPVASIMRTKYGEYAEYHTSLDDLVNVVTPEGLAGGFNALWSAIFAIENNYYPKAIVLGEPQLGKRNMYPTLSTKSSGLESRLLLNFLTWSDGAHSLLEIADLCGCPVWDLYRIAELLTTNDLVTLGTTPWTQEGNARYPSRDVS